MMQEWIASWLFQIHDYTTYFQAIFYNTNYLSESNKLYITIEANIYPMSAVYWGYIDQFTFYAG